MKIIKDRNNPFYKERNRAIGNAITVIEDNKEYYYEFDLNNDEALITTNNTKYIIEAVNTFRIYNKYIYKFYTSDSSFYQEFDKIFTFKLPIKCIQPSEFFIDKERLDAIDKFIYDEEIYIPVAIINEEYVALDGHTRLYNMLENYNKLVNVYIDSYSESIKDFIYIAKEQNIRDVSQMHVVSHEDYIKYWEGFLNDYYHNS